MVDLGMGGATGTPRGLVVIDLDHDRGDRPADVSTATVAGDVTIGVTRHARNLDEKMLDAVALTLTTAPSRDPRLITVEDIGVELGHLHKTIDNSPQAAAILVTTLKVGAPLAADAALAVESLAYSTLQSGREHLEWLGSRAFKPSVTQPDPIHVTRDGNALQITMMRPERRNAIDATTRDALYDALSIAIADPRLRVRWAGTGPSFCSGGDLADFGKLADPASAHLLRTTHSLARQLYQLRGRVAVRMHGNCAGAGVELPAFAKHVVAHPATTFLLPELSLGLIPGAGGTVSLTRRIGRWRTAWLALSGAAIDATIALEWGLVDELG